MWRRTFIILGITAISILAFFYMIQRRNYVDISQDEDIRQMVLDAIQPTIWQPVGKQKFIRISIDGDPDVEWLFLYRNIGDTGQIGGLIYDAQNRTEEVTASATPSLKSYYLMPDYTAGKSAGYLADESIRYQTIFVNSDNRDEALLPAESQVLVGDFLQMRGNYRGKTNRFSLFWWQDEHAGYGGALAYTPGWFSLSPQNPDDWGPWDEENPGKHQLVDELWAWEPQSDRSNICRLVHWGLTEDWIADSMQFIADYSHSQLTFCRGELPSEPVFPEAQVLAFLLDGNKARWQDNHADRSYKHVSVMTIGVPPLDSPIETVGVPVTFTDDDGLHDTIWEVAVEPSRSNQFTVQWRIVAVYDR